MSALNEIAEKFLYEKAKATQNQSEVTSIALDSTLSSTTPIIQTPEINSPQNYFNTHFFRNDEEVIGESLLKEKFREDVKKEVEKLRNLLYQSNSKLIYESQSSKNFWLEQSENFPYLSKLALILSNINSSSAFIERYFSICGFVQDKRKMNITQELFITRCLLRSNIKILNELEEN